MNRNQSQAGLTPREWLLAEATRRKEESENEYRLDDPATQSAAAKAGSMEERIVERARRLDEAPATAANVHRFLLAARWMTVLLMLLGLLAGAAASSGIHTGSNTIALSYAVVVLLGVPLALLLLWAILNFRPRGHGTPGLPGRGLWWLLLVFSRRLGLQAGHRHLAGALAELGRSRGRTLMALATHAFWTMFFVGCIGWLWLRFLGLRFDFSWETTLLSGPWLEDLILGIGWLPSLVFGATLPDSAQVQEVLAGRSAPHDRGLWASYLLGALVVYGLLPRMLLAFGFWILWRHARLRLDLARPGYLRLLPALAGPSLALGRRGKQPPTRDEDVASVRPASAGTGEAVLVGIELDDDACWPPETVGCKVLGRADNRRQQHEIRRAIELLDPRPEKIVALCSLARSPDRGIGRWLKSLRDLAPVEIRLADYDRLAVLGIDPDTRLQDWQRLAERFSLELDAPT